jgi:hypothetical protein
LDNKKSKNVKQWDDREIIGKMEKSEKIKKNM